MQIFDIFFSKVGNALTIEKELKEAREEIYNNINKNAITLEGELKSEFKDTNIGQKYLKILDRKREIENIDEIKNQVYNDLNIFFSRYYEEGDWKMWNHLKRMTPGYRMWSKDLVSYLNQLENPQ